MLEPMPSVSALPLCELLAAWCQFGGSKTWASCVQHFFATFVSLHGTLVPVTCVSGVVACCRRLLSHVSEESIRARGGSAAAARRFLAAERRRPGSPDMARPDFAFLAQRFAELAGQSKREVRTSFLAFLSHLGLCGPQMRASNLQLLRRALAILKRQQASSRTIHLCSCFTARCQWVSSAVQHFVRRVHLHAITSTRLRVSRVLRCMVLGGVWKGLHSPDACNTLTGSMWHAGE